MYEINVIILTAVFYCIDYCRASEKQMTNGYFKSVNNSLYGPKIFVISLQTDNLYVEESVIYRI